jgi:hypothetical protein
MKKFLIRTLYVLLGLITLAGTWLYVVTNSEKFATDIAYLKCSLDQVGSDKRSDNFHNEVRKRQRKEIVGRLREDWVSDKVLLNWVADDGTSENGLGATKRLNISTTTYSGYDYADELQRTFDRETLRYTWESKETSRGEVIFWIKRKCVIVDKSVFEEKRKKSAAATKAKQKI